MSGSSVDANVDTRFEEDGGGLELTPAVPPAPKPNLGPLLQGPGILSTSYKSVPTSTSKGEPWEKPPPPSDFGYANDPYLTTGTGPPPTLPDTPIGRIFKAAGQGWTETDLLTPEARAAAENAPTLVGKWLGKYITNPAATVESLPFKLAGALGGGLVQGAYEAGSAVSPSLGRALATLAIVAPGAEAGVPPRILPGDIGLPYGFRDITGPLPPEAIPKPAPDIVAKATPVGGERIPPEMPTSLPKQLTAADIGTVMDARYGNVTKSSDVTSADAVNRAVNLAVPDDVSAAMRRQFGKDAIVQKHLDNIDSLRDKPLSVQAWKGADQALTDDIYSGNIDPSAANQLRDIQKNLRGSLENPLPGDLTAGDGTGYDNLQAARQAAEQHAKMQAVENISRKAGLRVNEPQSVRSQIATFLSDENNTRGWSPDEKAALTNAQSTSQLYDLVHSMGGKLGAGVGVGTVIGHALTSGDLSSLLYAPIAAPAGWLAGEAPRMLENMVVRKRMQDALNVLGQSVPIAPLDTSLPPPVRALMTPDSRFTTYPTVGAGPPRQ